ncbi:MAG: heavy-metal-associated domain-containing protein [Elusimicrobia bacterium]|nr:heavy-metal-associated domain-containing protein [Elusimicrobiota bacterium]
MNNKVVVGAAALASAGLASICCIGPVVLTGLGLGSLGLAAGLTRYRPLFLGLTGLVLAAGFYLAYRKRTAVCADGSCELRSGSRTMKAGLWAITALAMAAATFPSWSARVLNGGSAAAPADALLISLKVSGMDCAACTAVIRKSVEKVPGVYSASVDFDGQRALVSTDGKADPQAVLTAVAAAGYKAEILDGGSHGKPRS